MRNERNEAIKRCNESTTYRAISKAVWWLSYTSAVVRLEWAELTGPIGGTKENKKELEELRNDYNDFFGAK
jgi:hypothetical protein